MKNVAVILAGGVGERFGSEIPKQFIKLAGKPVIIHTLKTFEEHPLIHEIYVVVPREHYSYAIELIHRYEFKKIKKILIGGDTRQESSRIGVFACGDDVDNVLIHDSVRPFISKEIITNVIEALNKYPGVDVAIPSPDTIIEISNENTIENIPPRNMLRLGQTPQGFKRDIIMKAHQMALNEGFNKATDDCGLVLRYKLGEIYVVDGSEYNIKITRPLDIHLADKIFQLKHIKISGKIDPHVKEYVKGKVMVVFGGTSGIGKDLVDLWNNLGGFAYPFSRRNGVDITKSKDVENALKKVCEEKNRIDVVVCTAGVLKLEFFDRMSMDEIMDEINVNFVGSIVVAKASIPYLKESRGSLILFGSSSYTRGRAGYIIYSATKAALVNFVQGLSDELSDYGVRVNIVVPERTDTPMRRMNFGNEDKSLLLSSEFVAKVTINAIGSDITGSVIHVRKQDEMRERMNGDM